MKKKITAVLSAMIMIFMLLPISVRAAGSDGSDGSAADIIDQVRQQLSAAFENIDQETAEEVFTFLKEKIAEGNLDSEEGILNAVNEGKEKFGVEISKSDAQKLVETMNKLEDMGFSAEYVIDKTESLYREYGADFLDHADEIVTGAVKNAASNAVGSFFSNLKNSIKSFFSSLFS